MAKFILKFLRYSAIGAFVLAIVFSAWVYFSTYHPGAVEDQPIVALAHAPQLERGQQIKVLSWNVQFFAGRPNNNFFFSGGNDTWPPKQVLTATAAAIADIIRQEDPDIILLQEVDEGAKRTYFDDQLQQLLHLLPEHYVAHTSSFYWLADYIPHPAIKGRVGMKLSIISKYQIEQARRYSLPAISSDNILIRQFGPKRAIHGVYLPIEGGGKLAVFNTHLSAFAQGTDTMALQIAAVEKVLGDAQATGEPWLLGGDFNLIPSDMAYQSLSPKERKYYNLDGSEIAPVFQHYKSVPSLPETLGENHQSWFTHIPNDVQIDEPNKTIDYIFYADDLALGDHYVRSAGTLRISDHLPVVAVFTLPNN